MSSCEHVIGDGLCNLWPFAVLVCVPECTTAGATLVACQYQLHYTCWLSNIFAQPTDKTTRLSTDNQQRQQQLQPHPFHLRVRYAVHFLSSSSTIFHSWNLLPLSLFVLQIKCPAAAACSNSYRLGRINCCWYDCCCCCCCWRGLLPPFTVPLWLQQIWGGCCCVFDSVILTNLFAALSWSAQQFNVI